MTVGELVGLLQGYIATGDLAEDAPVELELRRQAGMHVIPLLRYEARGVEIRHPGVGSPTTGCATIALVAPRVYVRGAS